MHDGKLLGTDRIKGTKNTEFPLIIGSGVAETGKLKLHRKE